MAPDDLNAPLGQDKPKKLPKLPVAAPQILAGALGLFGIAVVAWAIFVNDPLGGEPTAVVATGPPAKMPASGSAATASSIPATTGRPQADASGRLRQRPGAVAPPPGSKTVTIIDGSSGKRQDVIIPGKSSGQCAPKAPVDQRFLENYAPRRHPEDRAGRRAAVHGFRAAAQLPAGKTDAPRIAIIIGGLGISASGTADALSKLPAPVTLRVRALRRRSRTIWRTRARRKITKCCCRRRWSRSTIPTTIPARRRC